MATSNNRATTPPSAAKATGRTAVVVGGGPSGCLAAILLAQRGWHVHVAERRDQEAAVGVPSKLSSWVIAVFPRGINAILKAVPSATSFFAARAYTGIIGHGPDGTIRSTMSREGSGAALVHRTGVAALLTEALHREQAAGSIDITLHYGARFVGADFDAKVARFEVVGEAAEGGGKAAEGGRQLELAYDLLVGADGASSGVRAALLQAFPSSVKMHVICRSEDRVYKPYHSMPLDPAMLKWDPPGHGGSEAEVAAALAAGRWPAAGSETTPGLCFHVMSPQPGVAFATSFDIETKTYSGFVTTREELLAKPGDSRDAWFKWLDTGLFPPLPKAWHPLLAEQFAKGPIGRIADVQRATAFTVAGTQAVLIGDAAHTVTPSLGQGINSALQDAELLIDALDRHAPARGGPAAPAALEAALRHFHDSRMPQIVALQDLEMAMRTAMLPLLHGTWLQKVLARMGVIKVRPMGGPFGDHRPTLLQRYRVKAYFWGKKRIAAALGALLGPQRAHALLPWTLKGAPMIEVQVGAVDYVTMQRLIDAYALLVACAGTAAAAAVVAAGRLALQRVANGRR